MLEAEAHEKQARERALRITYSFAAVAEAFITDKLAQERRGKRAEYHLRSSFIAAWADRPIRNVSRLDVLEIINAKGAGSCRPRRASSTKRYVDGAPFGASDHEIHGRGLRFSLERDSSNFRGRSL